MMQCLINGESRDSISIHDRGLLYGDGLFESIVARAGEPLLWPLHWRRLSHDAQRLGIAPPDEAQLLTEIRSVLQGCDRATLKIILTRGQGQRGYRTPEKQAPTRIVISLPAADYPVEWSSKGIAATLSDIQLSQQPRLAGIKHLNRLEQVLAQSGCQPDFAEALVCDRHGNIIEGIRSNVFIVEQGVLITPDLSYCGVAGVMRANIIEKARALDIPIAVESLDIQRLQKAQACFVTNSLIGIWPVASIDRRAMATGHVTRVLQEAIDGDY